MSWATISAAMKSTIDAATIGLVVHDVMPGTLPDQDLCVVLPGEPWHEPDAHGDVVVNIRVAVRCTRATPEDAQRALAVFTWPSGAQSVVAAVRALPNLGGAVSHCQYVRAGSHGQIADSGANAGAFQADVIFKAVVQA